jgi:L-fuconolactonase
VGHVSAPKGIVDAHVHFWDPRVLRYPWLDGLAALDRPFAPADFDAATTSVSVAQMVVVECDGPPTQHVAEVQYFEDLAARDERIAGVVAFVDLTEPSTRDPALDAARASPLVRGIRQNIQGRPSGFCTQSAFVEGVRAAGARGLSFDLCATHEQLGDVVALVRACPGTRFILDHGGKPAIRDHRLEPWCTDIARLAALDNVWCKMSGLLTEAAPALHDDELRPYADHVLACFGGDRLMFGSDWPVLTLAGQYMDWYGFTQRWTSSWSADEQRSFYTETATHVYGLSPA